MKSKLWLVIIIVFSTQLWSATPIEQVRLSFQIQSPNRETAIRDLKAWSESKQGFLFALTDTSISVRIPALNEERLSEIEKKVLSLGVLMNRSIQRTDNTNQIAQLDSGIKVKEKHLADLQSLAKDADLKQTLALEEELDEVQTELEAMKGQRKQLLESSSLVDVHVSFSYTAPVNPAGDPGFGWVNSTGVFELIRGFGE